MRLKKVATAAVLALVAATLHSSPAQAALGPNLIPNPDLELAAPAWSQVRWGTHTTTFSTTDGELAGSKAATITTTAYTDGAAEWESPEFNVTGGKYTFQDSYKSNAYSELAGWLTKTDGTEQYVWIATLPPTPAQDTTSALPTDKNVWKRSDVTVTLPANAKSMHVWHSLSSVGYLSSDAYSFATGETTPPVTPPGAELVANPGMELSSGTVPTGWSQAGWGNSVRKFTYVSGGAHSGTRSVRVDVSSWKDGDAKWVYDSVPVTGGKYYTYSDWYKSSADTAVSLGYLMADGSMSWANLFLGIPASSTTWKQFSSGINAPINAKRAYFAHFIPRNGFLQLDDVSMKEAANPPGFTRATITLGYDDGSASIYNNALPVLDQMGFKSTQFVPTASIGRDVWSRTQIKNVYTRGHEIGGHSVNHPDLTTVSSTKLKSELTTSKKALESACSPCKVTSMATPFGSYNSTVINAIFANGYTSHRSVDVGYNTKLDFTAKNLHVQNIKLTTTLDEFKGWVDLARANKYNLNLVFHEVSDIKDVDDPDGDQYRVTVSMHRAMLQYLKDTGIAVVTQSAAVAEMKAQVG